MAGKIKVGIIGLGFMGTTHFDIYRSSGKAGVVAVADTNAVKLRGDISSVVGNIGGGNNKSLDLDGVSVYADGMELINDPAVELVDICLPVFLHKKFALAAINAGKHVLCEKPLAMNSADTAEIVAAAKNYNKCFMTGMCVRFWPEYRYKKFRKGQNAIFVIEAELPLSSMKQWFESVLTGKLEPPLPRPTPEVYIGPMPWEFTSVKDLGVFPVFDRDGIYRWVQLVECRNLR